MEKGKTRSYLLYALGEILLVMIGILLALQVNNWNEERKEVNRLQGYYQEMYEEVTENIHRSTRYISSDSLLVALTRRSLEIIDEADPDSLDQLKYTLGAVGTNYIRKYSFPVTNDFVANGYINSVTNDSLKLALRALELFLQRNEYLNQYINDQYQLKIEPFFNTNINYSHVVLDANKEDIYEGGPDTDYSILVDNMEAWNIINFKLEISSTVWALRKQGLIIMEFLNKKLQEEISQ